MTSHTLPKNILLNENETVLTTAKHSKIAFYIATITAFTGAIMFTLILWLGSMGPNESKTIPLTVILDGPLFVLAIPALAWFKFKNSLFVVTNQRIIDYTNIVIKTIIRELPLSKIENIELEISNLGEKLNYGKVTVQGTGGKTIGQLLEYPQKVKDTISSEVEKLKN